MRLISENLDVLLKGRTPADGCLLGGNPTRGVPHSGAELRGNPASNLLPIPLPAGAGSGLRLTPHRRSRSMEFPDALLARPGSPFLHKVWHPVTVAPCDCRTL